MVRESVVLVLAALAPGCSLILDFSDKAGVHDAFGPGTRIPALVITSHLKGDFVVDNTPYDTTSILATIEHRFGLAPLTSRDAAVNDMTGVYTAHAPES